MQAITPVDVHIENDWREGINVKQNTKISNEKASRMRTRVLNKPKTKKIESAGSSPIPKQVVMPKLVPRVRSRSVSPNRGPWVPPPGRSAKGQKVSWKNPKSRLEINPVDEILLNDSGSLDTARDQQNTSLASPATTFSTNENEKLMGDIQVYEKRIQALIDGIGMLKEQMHSRANPDQTDQLRSDIDSSLLELERLQKKLTQQTPSRRPNISRSQSPSPVRSPLRSSSADGQHPRRSTTPKVSFQDDPIIEKRRARSTTPIKGPIHLNPDREQLLMSLADSEGDIAQITNHISSVKDILTKLKMDDRPVSFEVEQLYQHRNELLRLIEQFERSNSKLKEFLHHQYHLEAEHGIIYEKYETLTTHIHELENENAQIRRLLVDRENDNITLLNELERIRTHTIGFDTMKSSLEHNRAHLQRELYAKEGEINRLQCALRSLERDLQRSRYQNNNTHRPIKRFPKYSTPTCLSPVHPSRATAVERFQAELNDRDYQIIELKKRLCDNQNQPIDGTNSEIVHLRAQLEQAEKLANEYKAQLHTQTLKTSANNSRNHLSEIELEKIRARLQKRIEELEPLPELLKQAESKNDKLQKQNNELQKRLADQSTFFTQTPTNDRTKDNYHHHSPDEDHRTLQRRIASLEEQNDKLLKTLNAKDQELRALVPMNKPNDLTNRNDTIVFKQRLPPQTSNFDLEQQIARLRLEYTQLKKEKDELERHFKSQFSELREKFEHSNHANRAMQNYINSLKTTYVALFNDTLPTSLTRYTTT